MTHTGDEQHVPAEDHSTGAMWSDPTPRPAGLPRPIRPWTRAEQQQHLADLDEAISGWRVGRPGRRSDAQNSAAGGTRG